MIQNSDANWTYHAQVRCRGRRLVPPLRASPASPSSRGAPPPRPKPPCQRNRPEKPSVAAGVTVPPQQPEHAAIRFAASGDSCPCRPGGRPQGEPLLHLPCSSSLRSPCSAVGAGRPAPCACLRAWPGLWPGWQGQHGLTWTRVHWSVPLGQQTLSTKSPAAYFKFRKCINVVNGIFNYLFIRKLCIIYQNVQKLVIYLFMLSPCMLATI
jgi:hypothetical protein